MKTIISKVTVGLVLLLTCSLVSSTENSTTAMTMTKDEYVEKEEEFTGVRSLQSSRCGCSSCSSPVLSRNAGGHAVGARIDWLKNVKRKSEQEACKIVCRDEFSNICGRECDPNQCRSGAPSPTPPGGTSLRNKGWTPSGKLGQCEGDCDRSSECASGLVCFQRHGVESVPGCRGRGATGMDYCIKAGGGGSGGGGGGSLSVVTQNLFWWNLFNIRNGGNVFNVYKSLGLQDVYLFQECDDVNRVKNGLGFGNMQTKQFGHGLAIAWNAGRFTKLSDGMVWVGRDKEVNPNWSPDRFVTWVRLQERSTRKTILVANHHGPLHIDTGGLHGPEDVASRIDRAISNGRRNGEVVILAGDMNVHANGRTLQSLARRGYTRRAGDWVDHIFTKSGLGSTPQVQIIRDTGSDHRGVKARWSSF